MQKNKLTLYIFIALFLGILAGYLYNVYVISAINEKINVAEVSVKKIDVQLSSIKDSASAVFKNLKAERLTQTDVRKAADSLREDKLEGFTILT